MKVTNYTFVRAPHRDGRDRDKELWAKIEPLLPLEPLRAPNRTSAGG